MAELTNEQKKAWAKTLYTRETLTQAEIAERVGVSRVTVNNWIGKGNWEQLKASITITREEQLKNLYRQLAELNNAIMGKPEGERFPNAAEADTISKLSNAIKKLETEVGLADIIFCILRPAQMGADLRFHAGEGDHPASGRVCQIKIILTWQKKTHNTGQARAGQLERAGGIRARTFGHQPHGHGNGNQTEAGKAGEER